ncbi:MAG: MFS transporter [Streptosporangiales bacterium]|nr:MFS transporter [Streptosporangiales bacterium]MBO0889280.1 MFS transporter [Acidothermales bacterium]
MTSADPAGSTPADDGVVSRQVWKWTILAAMASYLDAGSIVALGSGLALFQSTYHLSGSAVGALAAIGPNAIGCAVGSFIGGRLGDKLGRKRIYKYDLLVYAVGALLIALSFNAPTLFVGTFVVGVAVGADVPTSLALVGEFAPAKARGKLLGFTQIAWGTGPVVVLVLAAILSGAGLGLLGTRIVFLHLVVVALVTWALRQGMSESIRWRNAMRATTLTARGLRTLLSGPNLAGLGYTAVIYVFWGLAAGTAGIFTPFMIETLHAGGPVTGLMFSAAGFLIGIIANVLIFMKYADRGHGARKAMWGMGAIMQIVAYGMFIVLPFTVPVIIVNIVLFGIGASLAGEQMYKTISQEVFPTVVRGTAQGFTFGVARVLLGIWSFFVPTLAHAGFTVVGGLLAFFLLVSGVVGYIFMPNTAGKSLEQIESERAEQPAVSPDLAPGAG